MSSNLLKKLYYDPKTGYKSMRRLYETAKESDKSITLKKVKEFLSSQEEYQINKGNNKNVYFKISAPKGFYQSDLLFYPQLKTKNKGYSAMLSFIEIASRKGYVIPLKSKKELEITTAFKKLFELINEPIISITTDNGTEFLNKSVQRLFKQKNINHTLAQKDDHNKMSIVERFNRTIKNYLRRYFTANNTYNWFDVINDVMLNYNNSFHSTIHTTPDKITDDQIEKLRTDAIQYNSYLKENLSFKIGDTVRLLNSKQKFQKEGERYSKSIYIITDIKGYKYEVKNKETNHVLKTLYSINEIQKISDVEHFNPEPSVEKKENVIKEYKKQVILKKEGVDISNIIEGKRSRNKK
jgi:hypothetical protein